MAFTKINAAGIGTTETVTVDGLTVINDGSFGGNLSVGGTITYEDVTNVDSVGIITARAGVLVGSGITLSKDGDVFFTGIATGNGSGLTALNASNISSGTVPTARLGSGTASSSTFLRGDSSFQTVNTDLVSDTSPQLGGDLASNGHDILIADSDFIKFGTGNDLTIKHNGTHSVIENFTNDLYLGTSTSGQIILQKQGGDVLAKFISGASVELYENGTKVAETTSGGFNVEGVTYSNGLDMDDSHTILLGTDDDMQLYHNGSNAYIKNGTGQLLLRSGTHTFENAAGSTEYARINSSGHFGIGSGSNTNKPLHIYTGSSDAEIRLQTNSGTEQNSYISLRQSNGDLDFYTVQSGTSMKFHTENTERVRILSSGGITFNGDTASANALDDYEEGTYTPTNHAGTATFTNNVTARYRKIGQMVYVQFDISINSSDSGTNAGMTMPFASSISYGSGVAGWTTLGRPVFMHISGGYAYFMDNSTSGNSSQHLIFNETSGHRFIGNFWYIHTG